MSYLIVIYIVLVILIVRLMLIANSLLLKARKNPEVLKASADLERNYQFIKNLY